jgi:hypothetical protein
MAAAHSPLPDWSALLADAVAVNQIEAAISQNRKPH